MGSSVLPTSRRATRKSLKSRSAKSRPTCRSRNVICDSDKLESVPCSGNLDRVNFNLKLINFSVSCVFLTLMLALTDCGLNGVSSSPVLLKNPNFMFQGLTSMARNIRQLPCISRKSGEEGICMFAIDCLKSNGSHLGTCIDRFYFGSCCKISDKYISPHINEIEDNSINGLDFDNKDKPTKNDNNVDGIPEIATIRPTITTFNEPVTASVTPALTMAPENKISNDDANMTKTESPIKETTPVATTTRPTKVPIKPYVTITRKPVTKPVKITTRPITTTEIPFKISTFQTVSDEHLVDSPSTKKPVSTISVLTPKPSTVISTKPSLNTTKPITTTTQLNNINTTSNTEKPTTASKPFKPTTKPIYKPTIGPSKPFNATRPNENATFVNNYNRTTMRPSINYTSPTINIQQNTTKIPINKPAPSRRPLPTRRPVTRPTSSPIIRVNITSIRPQTTFITTSIKPTVTTFTSTTAKEKATVSTTPSTTTTTTTESTTASTTERLTTAKSTTTSTLPTTTIKEVLTTVPASKITTEVPVLNEEVDTEVPPVTLPQSTLAAVVPIEETPTKSTTTYPPGLSTWSTTVDVVTKAPEETKTTTAAPDEAWSPITPPSGWVLLSTIATSAPDPNPTQAPATESLKPEIPATPSSQPSSSSKPVFTNSVSESTIPSSSTTPTIVESSAKPASTASETSNVSDIDITSSSYSTSSPLVTPDDVTEEPRPVFVVNVTTSPMLSTVTSASPAAVTESTLIFDNTTKADNGTSISSNDTTAVTTESSTTAKSTVSNIELVTTPQSPVADSLNMSNYKEVCGRRLWPEARIVGGSKSSFGKWPWQISLRQWRTSTYLHKCGAALLNENWAITAAHCVEHVPPSELLVRLGEHDLANEDEPYGFQERRVQIVASHPHFDPATFEYDLALLRFYEPVTFQPNILPVCVPETDDNFVGKTAYVTGWGRLYDDGPLPSVLQEVTVPVINNTLCESMYRSAGFNEHIPNIFICAGWKKGGFDSCEGDSGGPMVLQRPDNRFLLAGVISWGIGCAEPNQPGVYTRISEFREWINQILQF